MEHISIILARLGFTSRYLASERASLDYCDEVVDGAGRQLYLDSPSSVSGLELERDPYEKDQFDNPTGLSAREVLQLEMYDGSSTCGACPEATDVVVYDQLRADRDRSEH